MKYRRSAGSPSTSVENSYAQAHISFLKYLPKLKLPSISEKAQMTARGADDVDVVGAHALLHRGGAHVGFLQVLLLQEVGLELHHAGARQQKRRVVGDEGGRRHALAALRLEEAQVFLADLGRAQVFHVVSFRLLELDARTSGAPAAPGFAPCGPTPTRGGCARALPAAAQAAPVVPQAPGGARRAGACVTCAADGALSSSLLRRPCAAPPARTPQTRRDAATWRRRWGPPRRPEPPRP